MATVAERIEVLTPGQVVCLSKGNGYHVNAERSGDGKTLRIVRVTVKGKSARECGFEVISSGPWLGR